MISKESSKNQITPLKIEVEERNNYVQRIRKGKINAGIFFGICLIFGYVYTGSLGFLIGAILFGLAVVAIIRYLDKLDLNPSNERYLITTVEFKEHEIRLEYKDKMDCREMSGTRSDFDFQKRWTTFSRPAQLFLQIIYKKETIISQYCRGDWDEDKFDEIIKHAGSNPW
jgi:hypothetical protein